MNALTLTATEAARLVGVHRQTFVEIAKRAGIEPVFLSGSRRGRYRREDVERAIRERQ